MKWTGDPKSDSTLSLMDDSGTAMYGQVTKDNAGGWNGFDYTSEETKRVGQFDTPAEAQAAVESAVKAQLKVAK